VVRNRYNEPQIVPVREGFVNGMLFVLVFAFFLTYQPLSTLVLSDILELTAPFL
jgi:hypothetical protein